MKRVHLFTILLLFAAAAEAQQLNASSFYDMYGTLHNAAAAGSKKYASVGGTYRTQWSGMPGSPKTGLLFGDAYLPKAKLGIGGYLYNDATGPLEYNGLQASVAYHIPMKNDASFSLGISGRVEQFSYDRAKLQGSLGQNDPTIMGNEERYKGDAGFGIAYTAKNFQVGASVNNLIESKLDLYEGSATVLEESQHYRHFYFHGNYSWQVDEATKVIPNLLFIYLPNLPLEVQGGARVEHANLFWYGLTWRARQAWMLSAGLRIKQKLNIGYSFDIYRSPLSKFDGGSNGHEIMLRYDFIK